MSKLVIGQLLLTSFPPKEYLERKTAKTRRTLRKRKNMIANLLVGKEQLRNKFSIDWQSV